MKKLLLLYLFLSILARSFAQNQQVNPENGLADQLKERVQFLTSQQLHGRSPLTGHDKLASLYIDSLFNSFSLKPYSSSYFQNFSILSRTPEERIISFNGQSFSYSHDFICMGPDPENSKDYHIVFGGFGNSDEIDSLDLQGKALFILTNNLRVGGMKVHEIASTKGCAMVIIANYSVNNQFELVSRQIGKEHSSTRFNLTQSTHMGASRFFARLGNPVPQIIISDRMASKLLGENPSLIAKKLQENKQYKPYVPNLKLGVNFKYQTDTIHTSNVIGFIPAQKPTQQCVIVSSHFDHLVAENGSWFPGADDNASGTAVLLELARKFAGHYCNGNKPLRNIVFAAFTAEEIGLLGSSHYSKNAIFNIDSATIVINMDMLGRESKKSPDERLLFISGENKKNEFVSIVNKFNVSGELKVDPRGLDDVSLFSTSDQFHFETKGIPAFLINTGIHNDYHQPTDTYEKLRYNNMVSIFELLYKTIDHFANKPNPWDLSTVKDEELQLSN